MHTMNAAMDDKGPRIVYDLTWQRTKHDPCTLADSFFEYTDIDSLPQYDRLRRLVNKWVVDIPKKSWPHWFKRYTSDVIMQHFGALHELLLFQVFRALGFMVEWEPKVNDASNPDLAITGEPTVLVEAAAFAADSDHTSAMDAVGRLLDRAALEIPATKHQVDVRLGQRPGSRPNEAQFRKWAEKWFPSMKVGDQLEYACKQSGLHLKLTAWAIPRDSGRRIHCGYGEDEAHYDQTGKSFGKVIKRKLEQHSIGKRTEPFLLSLGVVDDRGGDFSDDKVLDELYGQRFVRVDVKTGDTTESGRKPNGVLWRSGATEEPRTYPAAVLVANGWRDLDPARCRFTLFDNAYSNQAILPSWPLRRVRPSRVAGELAIHEASQAGLQSIARLLTE